MHLRRLAVLALLVAVATSAPAQGCRIRLVDTPTLRDELATSNFIVHVRAETIRRAGENEDMTLLHIQDVLKDHPHIAQRMPLELKRNIGNVTFLAFGSIFKGEADVYRGVVASPGLIDYARGLFAVAPQGNVAVLRYCYDFLGSTESTIAQDVFVEFSQAAPADVAQAMKKADPAKLRRLLADEKTSANLLQLGGFLLAHCGSKQDTTLLAKVIDRQLKQGQIDRLLIAYTLLDPQEGWAAVRKYAEKPANDFLVRFAALRAARFFYSDRPDVVAKKDVLAVVAILRDQKDMGDLAIEDLRKWRAWEQTERILPLFDREDIPKITRRAILRYALQCPDECCKKLVEEQRGKNPQWVKENEDLLALEK